jgi:hypothetical protein
VGGTTDGILGRPVPILDERSSQEREALLAAVNGLLGDYLAATDNPFAIPMRLRRNGQPLILERKFLSSALPPPRNKLLVLVHGLCVNDLQWTRKGSDLRAALARDLGGVHTDHLHYNSGLHPSTNGRGGPRRSVRVRSASLLKVAARSIGPQSHSSRDCAPIPVRPGRVYSCAFTGFENG